MVRQRLAAVLLRVEQLGLDAARLPAAHERPVDCKVVGQLNQVVVARRDLVFDIALVGAVAVAQDGKHLLDLAPGYGGPTQARMLPEARMCTLDRPKGARRGVERRVLGGRAEWGGWGAPVRQA